MTVIEKLVGFGVARTTVAGRFMEIVGLGWTVYVIEFEVLEASLSLPE